MAACVIAGDVSVDISIDMLGRADMVGDPPSSEICWKCEMVKGGERKGRFFEARLFEMNDFHE